MARAQHTRVVRTPKTSSSPEPLPDRRLFWAAGAGSLVVVLVIAGLLAIPGGTPPAESSGRVAAERRADRLRAETAVPAEEPAVLRVSTERSNSVERPDPAVLAAVAAPAANDAPVEAPNPPLRDRDDPVVAPKPPQTITLAKFAPAAAPPAAATVAKRPLPEFSTAADRENFVAHLRDMLYDGFHLGRAGFNSAEEHYLAARKLSENDPRLHYGFGLILWKNVRYDDALTSMQLAVDQAEPPYWGAWQTLIRLRIARKNVDGGLQDLTGLAWALKKHAARTAAAPEDVECARWMGRLIAFLEQPESDVIVDAGEVAQCDRLVGELLSENLLLLNAYRDGRAALQAEQAARASEAEATLAGLAQQRQDRTAEELERISREKEQQKDKSEKLELTAEQWKKWIDERLAKHDKELAELTKSYQELQIQLQQTFATILALGEEALARRDVDRRPIRRRFTPGAPDYAGAVALNQLQTQYRILEQRAAAIKRRGTQVMAARQADVARYQQATGKLVEQNDTLRKWNEVLANQERSTKQKSVESTPEARVIRRQVHALSAYFPFDPDEEKQRVLDSLPADTRNPEPMDAASR